MLAVSIKLAFGTNHPAPYLPFPSLSMAHAQGCQSNAIEITELEGHEDRGGENKDRDDATW